MEGAIAAPNTPPKSKETKVPTMCWIEELAQQEAPKLCSLSKRNACKRLATNGFKTCEYHRLQMRVGCKKWAAKPESQTIILAHRERGKAKLKIYQKHKWENDPEYRARKLARDNEIRKRNFFRSRASVIRCVKGGEVTAQDLARLWKNQKGCCALTGWRLNRHNSHVDHIIAFSISGNSDVSNLRWLHEDVNMAKGTLSEENFIKMCQAIIDYTTKHGATGCN